MAHKTLIAKTPEPPYYAVIFTSKNNADKNDSYKEMDKALFDLVQDQEGFLGFESASDNIGITVSYWSKLSVIQQWKENAEHQIAQKLGKEQWYSAYKVRIAKVERDYGT